MNAQNIEETPFEYTPELLVAAEEGDADAMYKVGICYYVGKAGTSLVKGEIPFERDYEKAFEYLSSSADKGSALAMLNLGNMYKTGIGVPKGKNLKQALKWYEKAAENGCVDAYANIAKVYETETVGLILERIEKVKAEDAGSAIYILGAKAADYNKLAAEKGSAIGAYNMGIAYYFGSLGLAVDYQESARWFRRAAELGYTQAVNDLAIRYINGIGVPQNKRVGLEMMKAAAINSQPMALHNIGVYYYNGIGLPRNQETALLFFLRANQLGHNNTQALHECYTLGLHGAKNYASETEWLAALKMECAGKSLPEIRLPEPSVMFAVDAGSVVNDCGSWGIYDSDGLLLTERRYDLIAKEQSTGKLIATLYGISTPLAEDGSEENPILEQMLNGLENASDAQSIFTKSLQLLQADYNNLLGYRSMAYYNIAVYWHNMNNLPVAEIYLNKALTIEPEFVAAREALDVLEDEKKEARKASKKQRRALVWDCILTGVNGLSNAMNQMAALKQSSQQGKVDEAEVNRQKNRERIRQLKQQGKEARQKMSGMINHRGVSNAYMENVGILTDLKNSGQYGTPFFRQTQEQNKKLREGYSLQHHESEDW